MNKCVARLSGLVVLLVVAGCATMTTTVQTTQTQPAGLEVQTDQLDELKEQARESGNPIPARLPPATPLFHVPSGMTRIFDRDLAAAGIPKRDERDRVVDIHALRVTFATQLCAAGVPLRTAQAALRHSKPELTANIYTDPKLLDVAGAIDALPALVLSPEAAPTTRRRATS